MAEKALTTHGFPFEVKQIGDDGAFEGWLSVYGNIDEGNDVVEPGAFTKTLKENTDPFPLLWQHNPANPIGSFTAEDRKEGLWIMGNLLIGEVRQAKEAHALMKHRVVKGLSIGYKTLRREIKNGVRHLLELKLREGSVVTFAMNPLAEVVSVKADEEEKDFMESLRRRQLFSAPDMMLGALWQSLDSIIYYSDLGSDESISAASESIDQFKNAYLEMLPGLLDMVKSDPSFKAIADRRGFEMALKAVELSAARVKFDAVGTFDPAGDTEDSAVPTDEKAADTSEDEVATELLRIAEKYKPAADEAA